MESPASRRGSIALPCVCSHTIVQTCFGTWRREDVLAAGTYGPHTCCVLLYFDAAALSDGLPGTAELHLTLQNVLPPGRGMTLCLTGQDGTARFTRICGPGPLCVNVGNLVIGHTEGLLRITLRPDWPCSALTLIEPCAPAPRIVVTPVAPCGDNGIQAEQQRFDIEFDHSASTPPIDTVLSRQCTFYVTNAGDAPFTADLETCAEAPQWVRDVRLTMAAGETRALVTKYYGAFARIKFSAAGASKAKVRFIGQYFT